MRILAFVFALFLGLITAATSTEASPVGTWHADVAGQTVVLVLERGGSGSLNGERGSWRLSGSRLILSSPDGESVTARYSKNVITVTFEGTTLTFRRQGRANAKAASGRPVASSSASKPFVPAKTVKARTKKLRTAKASLKVPRGWKTGWAEDGDTFVLAPSGKLRGKAAVTISVELLSVAQKRQAVGELLTQAASELVDESARAVVGPENFTVGGNPAGRLIGRGVVNGQTAEGYLGGIIVGDFGIRLLGVYPAEHADIMRASLDTILASIRAKAPKKNKRAMKLIVGCWVQSTFESDSRTGSTSLVSQYNFRADGSVRYKSSASVTVDGGGYNSSDEKHGSFAIFGDQLMLRYNDGTTNTYTVSESHGRLKMGSVRLSRC